MYHTLYLVVFIRLRLPHREVRIHIRKLTLVLTLTLLLLRLLRHIWSTAAPTTVSGTTAAIFINYIGTSEDPLLALALALALGLGLALALAGLLD